MKNIPHNKKYIIQLSAQERAQLQHITRSGNRNARVFKRAQALLKSYEGLIDEDIASHVGLTSRSIMNIRQRYCQGGLERALHDASRPGQAPVLDNKKEARLIAIACSSPPEGSEHWTLELLQEKLLKDGVVDHISTVAIWYHLRDRGIKPWRKKNVVRAKG